VKREVFFVLYLAGLKTMMAHSILSSAKIKHNCLWHDEAVVYKTDETNHYTTFFEEAYKNRNMGYPKFFKMDNLCKLGILCAEPILKNETIGSLYPKEKTAVVLSNKDSSLQTDRAYAKTMSSFPSPALFVYTLPNIVTGEICIKHKLTGENTFFIEPAFNADLLHNYTEILLQKADAALCGWLQADENTCEGFLYFVAKHTHGTEKNANFISHNSDNINKLYYS
jgi:hypothetical protein